MHREELLKPRCHLQRGGRSRLQIRHGDTARLQVFTRKINPAASQVFGHIPQNVGHLKGETAGTAAGKRFRAGKPPDVNRGEPHR